MAWLVNGPVTNLDALLISLDDGWPIDGLWPLGATMVPGQAVAGATVNLDTLLISLDDGWPIDGWPLVATMTGE